MSMFDERYEEEEKEDKTSSVEMSPERTLELALDIMYLGYRAETASEYAEALKVARILQKDERLKDEAVVTVKYELGRSGCLFEMEVKDSGDGTCPLDGLETALNMSASKHSTKH